MTKELLCPLAAAADRFPKKVGVADAGAQWSYQELDHLVNGLCHSLQRLHIHQHTKVAFIAKTDLPTILLFFALFRLQAIACPLSFRLPQAQIDHVRGALDQPLLLALDEISFQASSHGPTLISEEQLATFLLTSGSSGSPKIACHSLGNHYYSALGANAYLNLSSKDKWLLSLPLFHVGGLAVLFRCFLSGSTVLLSEQKQTPSFLSLVPTQLYRLLKDPPSFLQQTKGIIIGGAPLSAELYRHGTNFGLNLIRTYGMTEMSSSITFNSTLLPHRELAIRNQEIFVRGKTLFQGYWTKEEGLVLPLNAEGWFATKDLGDENFCILGRKDNLFISGGENVQPEEIEQALCTLSGIIEAIVVPFDDLEFGERPVAFIQDETGEYTLETIQTALRKILPAYKIPIHLFPLEKSLFKSDRRKLKCLAASLVSGSLSSSL